MALSRCIDTADNTVAATVPVGTFPAGVAVTPDGKHAYVPTTGGVGPGSVSVIDTATNTVVATVGVGISAQWGRRLAGWETRLRCEFWAWRPQRCFGDRHPEWETPLCHD
jgi:YVTN family beta-propeller protein